jgi:hypothetical protein
VSKGVHTEGFDWGTGQSPGVVPRGVSRGAKGLTPGVSQEVSPREGTSRGVPLGIQRKHNTLEGTSKGIREGGSGKGSKKRRSLRRVH